MFIQKIRRALNNRNRTSRYLSYATGEVILVMIGILLALQVNNWNTKRKNRILEQSMIKEIHAEFLLNKTQFDSVVYYHQTAYNNAVRLIRMMPIRLGTTDLDSVSYYINQTFWRFTFNPSVGTIQSLINTSSMDIISNDSLRHILLIWNGVYEDYSEEEESAVQFVKNFYDPFFEQNFSYEIDLDDPRTDLSVLTTFEFENMIKHRVDNLHNILYNRTDEIGLVKNLINRVLQLTSTDEN